ncbi:MAG: hypothetical protein GX877_03790 [Bacteroidales bacterium]|nr:hypothetical protein [Bacteroidales bacterium]
MKQCIKYLAAIVLTAVLFVPVISNAQKMPKKHKNAPEKTVVVVTNPLVENFDASEYPHLQFYYTPQEMPHFLEVLNKVRPIPPKEGITGIVVDKEGTIAYVRLFSDQLSKNMDNRDETSFTILSVAARKGSSGESRPLEDQLKNYVIREKVAKKDSKKSYTPGQEPTFKGWDKGLIEGMELPDFNLVAQDGTETSIKEVLDGKPGFVVFTNISEDGKTVSPLLWHIEHILYNYFPPRTRR